MKIRIWIKASEHRQVQEKTFSLLNRIEILWVWLVAVCLLHWHQNSISLWSGWFCQRSHRVSRHFSASVIWVLSVVGIAIIGILVVSVRVCLTTVALIVIASTIFVVFSLVSLSFELTALISVMAWFFCTGDMSVWAFQCLVAWHVASQCLLAIHMELPNRSAPTLFQDATQSIPRCHSPNEPGLVISPGVEMHLGI